MTVKLRAILLSGRVSDSGGRSHGRTPDVTGTAVSALSIAGFVCGYWSNG